MNILIGTPAYNCQVHLDYLYSILGFHNSKLPITIMGIGNESLITRGRNAIISYFYANKKFTHLLFLDADIGISSESLLSLISKRVDIIGALVPLKGRNKVGDKVYNFTPYSFAVEPDVDEKAEVKYVGTAAMLISRTAADTIVSHSDPYTVQKYNAKDDNATKMYDVFKTAVIDGQYLSEDYYFCDKARKLGFKVYVDLDVKDVIHNGICAF